MNGHARRVVAGVRRLALAFGASLALSLPVSAQTGISGTVTDQTGACVSGARVTAIGPQGRTATVTGAGGQFTLLRLAPGRHRLRVSRRGFSTAATKAVVVDDHVVDVGTIVLALAPVGETVVVTASKGRETLASAPATTSVVTAGDLALAPAANYGDLLRTLPGVNAIQLSARDVNLTTRQATWTSANSQLVLVDGRSICHDFFGLVMWDLVPVGPSDIEQIDVLRGPASAIWGGNALTGVVNIITKTPRHAPGGSLSLTGGIFGRGTSATTAAGAGSVFGASASVAGIASDRWSYRVSGGFFHSDAFARPAGRIPVITDPRDATRTVGGASYPADGTGAAGSAFGNRGTDQPKFAARIDQEISGGRITYEAGVAGTEGIMHTALGPFDIQRGAFMGYARAAYERGATSVTFFSNVVNGSAPDLLLVDPATRAPLHLDFRTRTYDLEARHAVSSHRHVLRFGGNVRRNLFDVSIAPAAKDRTELGAYLQDELGNARVRLHVGGRVDKFGNVGAPILSPRVAVTLAPWAGQTVRVSYNRAFRAPSVLNNYLDVNLMTPVDLSGLAPLLPPSLRPAVQAPISLVVRAVGSALPIAGAAQKELQPESVTAYEVAATQTAGGTTIGAAFYVNDVHENINFSQLPAGLDPYSSAAPPPGWPLPTAVLDAMAQKGIVLPRTGFTYLNLGPLRQRGLELSVDHRFNAAATAFANYSWQARPRVLEAPLPFPRTELAFAPSHRINAGLSVEGGRLLGAIAVNRTTRAFWSDVLSSPYHGFSSGYTMVNATAGMRWSNGRMTTLVKITNLLDQPIQQHVFGDIIRRAAVTEVRMKF